MKLRQLLLNLYKNGKNQNKFFTTSSKTYSNTSLLDPMYNNYSNKTIHLIKYIPINPNKENEKKINEKLQQYFRECEMKEYDIQKTYQEKNLSNPINHTSQIINSPGLQ